MRAANYVEETTTSIAGTNGNGAVTLTQITSIPRFSTVFGTQATTVRYVIEDTVNKKFETGIGSVSSNVLTRTRPQVTWDGTTYDDSTPSPIAFGSTPTSGNIKIKLAATAEIVNPTIPGVNRTIGSDTWRDYHITGGADWGNAGQGVAMTANLAYYTCYRLDLAGALDGIQTEVTTAVASSGLKLSLYAVGTNGLPANKILDFNVIDTATTGIKTDTVTSTWSPAGPVWLTPGWYYIGFISDSAISIRGNSNAEFDIGGPTPLGRSGAYGWGRTVTESGSYASGLPAAPAPTAIVTSGSDFNVPWIGLRVTP